MPPRPYVRLIVGDSSFCACVSYGDRVVVVVVLVLNRKGEELFRGRMLWSACVGVEKDRIGGWSGWACGMGKASSVGR